MMTREEILGTDRNCQNHKISYKHYCSVLKRFGSKADSRYKCLICSCLCKCKNCLTFGNFNQLIFRCLFMRVSF